MSILESDIIEYNLSVAGKIQQITRDYCGACWNHRCCCACKKDADVKNSCRYCKYCDSKRYELHYVCFDCRRSYKPNYHVNPIIEIDFHFLSRASKKCTCGKICAQMSMSTRVPKKSDDIGWKLLQFITFNVMKDFKNADSGTLANLWYSGGGIGATTHYPNRIKRQFYVPHKMSEIDEWKEYLLSTKIME